jgi:hypothetical protein
MSTTLDSVIALESGIDALHQSGDLQSALSRIDVNLAEVFGGNGENAPEKLADLGLLGMLAVHKGRLLQEVTALLLRHEDTGETEAILDPDRRQEFVAQAFGWFQIGVAAIQRGMSQAQPGGDTAWRQLLHRQLAIVRQACLALSATDSRDQLDGQRSFIRHLFSLLWLCDDFAGAEDLLYLLADLEGKAEVLVTGQTFYQEILKLNDERLAAGGLPRPEILAALADWNLNGR